MAAVPGSGSLISVRTEVVLDVLVGSMHAAAAQRASGDGDAWLRSVGWHARAVELERFARARAPMPWLQALLGARAEGPGVKAVAALSAELAAAEPVERPRPRVSRSWQVPGPGGHVRHYLALRACEDAGVDPVAGKRAWMTGFFRHCCEEAVADRADDGA